MAIQEQSIYYKQFQAEQDAFWKRRRARRIDHDKVPREILDQLKPTWKHWEAIPEPQARDLQATDTIKLFLRGRDGWEAVPNFRRREIGQAILAFRHLPESWRPGGGAKGRRTENPEPLPVQSGARVVQTPVATITSPPAGARLEFGKAPHFHSRLVEHRVREGETATQIAARLTGEADPNRVTGTADGGFVPQTGPIRPGTLVRVRTGKELAVSGSARHLEHVTLAWQGPVSGRKDVPVDTTRETWETTLPAHPGAYTLTVTGGEVPHRIEVEVIGLVKIADIAYEPATGTFYALTENDLQELQAAGRKLDEAVDELLDARARGDREAIARATDLIHRELRNAGNAPLTEGADTSHLTEITRFAGRKATLVPKGKVRRHWRTYTLDADIEKRSRKHDLIGADGRLSTTKLLNRMKKQFEKKSGLQFEMPVADSVSGGLTAWAEAFNNRPETLLFEGRDAEGNALVKTTLDAQLQRYSAGYTLAADFKPASGRFGIHAKARAELVAAEGRIDVEGYFPDDAGWPLQVSLPLPDGGRKEADLGAIRARLKLALHGYAGASASLSADIEFSVEQGRVLLRGVEEPQALQKQDPKFEPVATGASAFIGVRAGCEAGGALEWDNPQYRQRGRGWRALAAVGADANLSFGAGAEAEFTISYERGKFYIRAKAGAVFGVGCGGDLAFTVHADHIYELVMFVYHKLKNEDFDRLQFMEEFAFEVLYRLFLFELWKGEKLAEMYESGVDALNAWWNNLVMEIKDDELRRQAGQTLASNINARPELLLYATPEAKGHMLAVLCHTSLFSFEEEQEEAILAVLGTLQSLRDYHETLEHLTFGAEKITVEEGRRILHGILDGREHRAWHRLENRLRRLEEELPARARYDVAVRFAPTDTDFA